MPYIYSWLLRLRLDVGVVWPWQLCKHPIHSAMYTPIVVTTPQNMEFTPTIKEKRERGEDRQNFFVEKIADCIEKMYWMYYINLPYYLMVDVDSFILHTFILVTFSLSVFGVVKYCFL